MHVMLSEPSRSLIYFHIYEYTSINFPAESCKVNAEAADPTGRP